MIDPIMFEVIRNALLEATEEMAIAFRRSAYSTNMKTRADFSCAFFDRELRVVAQANAQPNHFGSFVELVPRALRTYGIDNLGPGDAILTNDPYGGGGAQLNDITLISPTARDFDIAGELSFVGATLAVGRPRAAASPAPTNSPAVSNFAAEPAPTREQGAEHGGTAASHGPLPGYVAKLAHHVDVGGGASARIDAFREVFQEGVIIPPVRLVRDERIVDDIFRLVLAQIRSRHETAGDFRAQIAANNTGACRLSALVARMSLEVVRDYVDELIAYTERRARSESARLPRGIFAAEGTLDNDGFTDQPERFAARIIIDDSGVAFDLNGCDPQRRAPVNATFAQTFSCCAYALKCLIDPDVPTNAGFYACVRVDAPAGTFVNCTSSAPVVGGWETNSRLTHVIFNALAPELPERMPAGTKR